MPKSHRPSLLFHKPSGQARVRIASGRRSGTLIYALDWPEKSWDASDPSIQAAIEECVVELHPYRQRPIISSCLERAAFDQRQEPKKVPQTDNSGIDEFSELARRSSDFVTVRNRTKCPLAMRKDAEAVTTG